MCHLLNYPRLVKVKKEDFDVQSHVFFPQESEEVKSNSLDKELKQKESELLANQQEKNNTELVSYHIYAKYWNTLSSYHICLKF